MNISKTQSFNKNNSISFGWLPKTHSYLTKCAVEKIPELLPYKKFLQLGSMAPDIRLSQTGFVDSNAHVFFGENFNAFNGTPQNASDFFCDLLSKAFEFLNNGNKRLAMYKAGETLHFLQDMAVPLHTKKECQGLSKLLAHVSYENVASKNHDVIDRLAQNKPEIRLPEIPYDDLFIDTFKKSSSMDNPFEKNTNRQKSIEYALSNAYEATCKFLKKFSAVSETSAK